MFHVLEHGTRTRLRTEKAMHTALLANLTFRGTYRKELRRVLVAGGGFELHPAIENTYVIDFTIGYKGEIGGIGSPTVQKQYKSFQRSSIRRPISAPLCHRPSNFRPLYRIRHFGHHPLTWRGYGCSNNRACDFWPHLGLKTLRDLRSQVENLVNWRGVLKCNGELLPCRTNAIGA